MSGDCLESVGGCDNDEVITWMAHDSFLMTMLHLCLRDHVNHIIALITATVLQTSNTKQSDDLKWIRQSTIMDGRWE